MDIDGVLRIIAAACSTVAIVSGVVCLQLSREEPVRRQRLRAWLVVLIASAGASLIATSVALFGIAD